MKMFLRILSLAGGVLLTGFVAAQNNSPVDPVKLMQQVERQSSPSDEVVRIAMRLVDSSGKTSQRSAWFYSKQRDPGSLESMKLIRFDKPAEMNGSAVLTVENTGRPDDQWLYLPAYHASRKVPPSSRSDRYMGTDFFYEDVSDDKIEQYQYVVSGQETISDRSYIVIEQTPVAEELKRETAYGKKVQWVDPERAIVAKIEYFDRQGALRKRFEASGPTQVAGRWRWSEVSMTDFKLKHKTYVQYSDRKIDQGLDASLFTVRSLERGN